MKKFVRWVILFLVAFFAFSAITVALHRKYEVQKLADLAEDMSRSYSQSKSTSENEGSLVDFSSLEELNPDIYAWIYIPNSEISFPVLQSTTKRNDDYYLHHNYDGSYGYPASIYTQRRNAKDFSDPVTVVYGHDMKDGSMFAGLHEYASGDYMLEHPYVFIYRPDEVLVYEVFAAVSFDDRLILEAYEDFANETDVDMFLEDLRKAEGVDHQWDDSVITSSDNQFLVLSTCEERSDQRFLVVAKRIR